MSELICGRIAAGENYNMTRDNKTICELYYVCCDDIQDMELSTALKQLLTLLAIGFGKSCNYYNK